MGKTKQASIRFDPEKLELVQRREKLRTSQKVVDFLMDSYYWQNKLFIAPQLNALGQTLPYVVPQVPRTAFEAYELEINNAGGLEELGRIGRNLDNELAMNRSDKEKLTQFAKKKSETFEI